MYLDVGGIPDGRYNKEVWNKYCDRVGWKVNGEWSDKPQKFLFSGFACGRYF
ncbi:hypothetical protein F7734_20635 [Scytonema sp. UIC 10036]|nr:hypothetical protein [Scytonema sp. UIC 10036]